MRKLMDTINQPQDVNVPGSLAAEAPVNDDLSIEVASQWRLMWWKFQKHRLAVIGGIVVATFYFVALFADFFAPVSTSTYIAEYAYAPPQTINLFHDGRFEPYVNGYKFERDPVSFKKIWALDEEKVIPVALFVQGEPTRYWG
jgi:peptide/nickel transport system permease protein